MWFSFITATSRGVLRFETEGTYTAVSMRTAITQAFKKVEKKGTICQLWQTGKFLYTAGSWGATALS
jgi:hypothetical protein